MKKLFSEQPVFLILLPLYYLISTLNDYYPVLSWDDLFHPAALLIVGLQTVIFLLFSLLWKQQRKYALLVLFLSVVSLFFGSLLNALKLWVPELARYKFVLTLLVAIAIAIGTGLRRSHRAFRELFLYLNILLLTFTVVEIGRFTIRSDNYLSNLTGNHFRQEADFKAAICDTCVKPDIYFIVFDGYSSSRTLNEYWGHDNGKVDTFLRQLGYFVANTSHSNYNITPYSIGSILNMNYHKTPPRNIDLREFCRGSGQMRPNKVFELFRANHYRLINQSFFPLSVEKPTLDITYAASKRHMLLAQTLPMKFQKDIGWNFGLYKSAATINEEIELAKKHRYQIQKAYDELKITSAQQYSEPVFVYTHFLFPHDPYFFDSTGRTTPEANWFSAEHVKDEYLSQLKYANTFIRELSGRLIKDARRPRIVLFISDHGFRGFREENLHRLEFNNLFAVYFPDGDYSSLTDSVSAVNTFPLIFNKYFHAGMEIKKDTMFHAMH